LSFSQQVRWRGTGRGIIMNHDAKPQWVFVKGKPHHVSEYAYLSPQKRPYATCPLCNKRVILKLGDVRAHHYAHYDMDVCAASWPETALHLNMKYYLLDVLSSAKKLMLSMECMGYQNVDNNRFQPYFCTKSLETTLAHDWDCVSLEYRFSGLVFDIVLLRDNKILAVIEIYATHRVDQEKIDLLNKEGIPWVEISASEDFYEGEDKWLPDRPLPHIDGNYPQRVKNWQCPDCKKKLEGARQRAIRSQHNKANTVRWYRFVDIYYPSGKQYREVFCLSTLELSEGLGTNAWLTKGYFKTNNSRTLKSISKGPHDHVTNALKKEFHVNLEELRSKGALVDSPMNWQKWPGDLDYEQVIFEKIVFPCRYQFDNGRWKKDKRYGSLSWDGYWDKPPEYFKSMNKWDKCSKPLYHIKTGRETGSTSLMENKAEDETFPEPARKFGICLLCGEATNDYVYFNHGDGTCECRKCQKKGRN
jgi:hypothetical protein